MGDFPYDFPHGLIKLFVSLSVCLPRYLPEVYNLEKDVLKNLIKDMPVSVMFDETPDAEGRCVLNIMVSPLAKDKSGKIRSYLIDTVFLDKCNHSTVANAAVNALNDKSVKASVSGVIDTDLFWHSMQEPLPQLSRLAKRYKDCVTNSADVERSNSIYKLVLSSRRRSLSEPNIKALVFLYVNLKVQCAHESVTEESKDGDDDYEE